MPLPSFKVYLSSILSSSGRNPFSSMFVIPLQSGYFRAQALGQYFSWVILQQLGCFIYNCVISRTACTLTTLRSTAVGAWTQLSPSEAVAGAWTQLSQSEAAAGDWTQPSPSEAAAGDWTQPSPSEAAAGAWTQPSPSEAAAKASWVRLESD